MAIGTHRDVLAHADKVSRQFRGLRELSIISDAEINALTTLAGFKTLITTELAKEHEDLARDTQFHLAVDSLEALGVTNAELAAVTTGWAGFWALFPNGQPNSIEQPIQ